MYVEGKDEMVVQFSGVGVAREFKYPHMNFCTLCYGGAAEEWDQFVRLYIRKYQGAHYHANFNALEALLQ